MAPSDDESLQRVAQQLIKEVTEIVNSDEASEILDKLKTISQGVSVLEERSNVSREPNIDAIQSIGDVQEILDYVLERLEPLAVHWRLHQKKIDAVLVFVKRLTNASWTAEANANANESDSISVSELPNNYIFTLVELGSAFGTDVAATWINGPIFRLVAVILQSKSMLIVPSTSDAKELVDILERCETCFSELVANDGGLHVDAVYARDLAVAIKAVKRNLSAEVAKGVTTTVVGTMKTAINFVRGNYMIDEGLGSGLGMLASAGLGYHKHMEGEEQLKLIRGAVGFGLPHEVLFGDADSVKKKLDLSAKRTKRHKGNWVVEATYIQTLRRVLEACFSGQQGGSDPEYTHIRRNKVIEFAVLGGSALGDSDLPYNGVGLLKILDGSRVLKQEPSRPEDTASEETKTKFMLVNSFKDGETLASVMTHAAYEGLSEIKETEEERTRKILKDAYEIIEEVWANLKNKQVNEAHGDDEAQLLLSEAKPKLHLAITSLENCVSHARTALQHVGGLKQMSTSVEKIGEELLRVKYPKRDATEELIEEFKTVYEMSNGNLDVSIRRVASKIRSTILSREAFEALLENAKDSLNSRPLKPFFDRTRELITTVFRKPHTLEYVEDELLLKCSPQMKLNVETSDAFQMLPYIGIAEECPHICQKNIDEQTKLHFELQQAAANIDELPPSHDIITYFLKPAKHRIEKIMLEIKRKTNQQTLDEAVLQKKFKTFHRTWLSSYSGAAASASGSSYCDVCGSDTHGEGNELLRCKNNTWGSFAEAKEQQDLGIVTGRCSGSIHAACRKAFMSQYRDIFHPDSDNYLCIQCRQQQPQSGVTEVDVFAPTFVHEIMAEATASKVADDFEPDRKEGKERVALWTELTSLIDTMGQRLHCCHQSEADSNHEDVQDITIERCKKALEEIEAKQKGHEETMRVDGLEAKLHSLEIMLLKAREDTLRAEVGRGLSSANEEVELIDIFSNKYSELTSLSKHLNDFVVELRGEKDDTQIAFNEAEDEKKVKHQALEEAENKIASKEEELESKRAALTEARAAAAERGSEGAIARKELAEKEAASAESAFDEAKATFKKVKSEFAVAEITSVKASNDNQVAIQNYERGAEGASAVTSAADAAKKWLRPQCHAAGTSLAQSYQTGILEMRPVFHGVQGASVAEEVYEKLCSIGRLETKAKRVLHSIQIKSAESKLAYLRARMLENYLEKLKTHIESQLYDAKSTSEDSKMKTTTASMSPVSQIIAISLIDKVDIDQVEMARQYLRSGSGSEDYLAQLLAIIEDTKAGLEDQQNVRRDAERMKMSCEDEMARNLRIVETNENALDRAKQKRVDAEALLRVGMLVAHIKAKYYKDERHVEEDLNNDKARFEAIKNDKFRLLEYHIADEMFRRPRQTSSIQMWSETEKMEMESRHLLKKVENEGKELEQNINDGTRKIMSIDIMGIDLEKKEEELRECLEKTVHEAKKAHEIADGSNGSLLRNVDDLLVDVAKYERLGAVLREGRTSEALDEPDLLPKEVEKLDQFYEHLGKLRNSCEEAHDDCVTVGSLFARVEYRASSTLSRLHEAVEEICGGKHGCELVKKTKEKAQAQKEIKKKELSEFKLLLQKKYPLFVERIEMSKEDSLLEHRLEDNEYGDDVFYSDDDDENRDEDQLKEIRTKLEDLEESYREAEIAEGAVSIGNLEHNLDPLRPLVERKALEAMRMPALKAVYIREARASRHHKSSIDDTLKKIDDDPHPKAVMLRTLAHVVDQRYALEELTPISKLRAQAMELGVPKSELDRDEEGIELMREAIEIGKSAAEEIISRKPVAPLVETAAAAMVKWASQHLKEDEFLRYQKDGLIAMISARKNLQAFEACHTALTQRIEEIEYSIERDKGAQIAAEGGLQKGNQESDRRQQWVKLWNDKKTSQNESLYESIDSELKKNMNSAIMKQMSEFGENIQDQLYGRENIEQDIELVGFKDGMDLQHSPNEPNEWRLSGPHTEKYMLGTKTHVYFTDSRDHRNKKFEINVNTEKEHHPPYLVFTSHNAVSPTTEHWRCLKKEDYKQLISTYKQSLNDKKAQVGQDPMDQIACIRRWQKVKAEAFEAWKLERQWTTSQRKKAKGKHFNLVWLLQLKLQTKERHQMPFFTGPSEHDETLDKILRKLDEAILNNAKQDQKPSKKSKDPAVRMSNSDAWQWKMERLPQEDIGTAFIQLVLAHSFIDNPGSNLGARGENRKCLENIIRKGSNVRDSIQDFQKGIQAFDSNAKNTDSKNMRRAFAYLLSRKEPTNMSEKKKQLDEDYDAYMNLGISSGDSPGDSSGTSSEAPRNGDLHETFVLKFAARTANAVQAILDGLATEPPERLDGIDGECLRDLQVSIVEGLKESMQSPPPWLSSLGDVWSTFSPNAALVGTVREVAKELVGVDSARPDLVQEAAVSALLDVHGVIAPYASSSTVVQHAINLIEQTLVRQRNLAPSEVLEGIFKQPKYSSLLQLATERTWHLIEKDIKKEVEADVQTQSQITQVLADGVRNDKSNIHHQSDLVYNKIKSQSDRRRSALSQTAKELAKSSPGAAGLAPNLSAYLEKLEDEVKVTEKRYKTARQLSVGMHMHSHSHSHVHYHSLYHYGPPTGEERWLPAGRGERRRRKASTPLQRPASASPRLNGRDDKDIESKAAAASVFVGGRFEKELLEKNKELESQLRERDDALENLRGEKEECDEKLRAVHQREFDLKADNRRKLVDAEEEIARLAAKVMSQSMLSEKVIHNLRQIDSAKQRCPVCNKSHARTENGVQHQARKPNNRPRSASAAASGRRAGQHVRVVYKKEWKATGQPLSRELQDAVTSLAEEEVLSIFKSIHERVPARREVESRATIGAICSAMRAFPGSRPLQYLGCCVINELALSKEISAVLLGSSGACEVIVHAINSRSDDLDLLEESLTAVKALIHGHGVNNAQTANQTKFSEASAPEAVIAAMVRFPEEKRIALAGCWAIFALAKGHSRNAETLLNLDAHLTLKDAGKLLSGDANLRNIATRALLELASTSAPRAATSHR